MLVPHDKFLTPPLLTSLKKKKESWSCHWWPTHIPLKSSSDEMLSTTNIGFAWLQSTSTISCYNTSFFFFFFLTTIKMEIAFTKISKLWRNFASRTLSFLSYFPSKLKRYNFGGPKGKHLAPPKLPPPPNQTPLPPIFSHIFSDRKSVV